MQETFPPIEQVEQVRHFLIPQLSKLGGGELPVGASGVTTDEGKLAVLGPFRIPLQEVLDFRGLAVLVGPEDADVEVETRILEIVGIAAVERHLFLRRENEADVVIAFEPI